MIYSTVLLCKIITLLANSVNLKLRGESGVDVGHLILLSYIINVH